MSCGKPPLFHAGHLHPKLAKYVLNNVWTLLLEHKCLERPLVKMGQKVQLGKQVPNTDLVVAGSKHPEATSC